jgi:hypothetical protein
MNFPAREKARGKSRGMMMVLTVMMVLAGSVLGGCTAAALVAGSGGEKQGVNLTQANYGAADMLSQQTQAVLGRDTVLQIGMISDIAHPAAETPFGKTVASHIAARFVQLGYHVSAASYNEMSGGAPLPTYHVGGVADGAYNSGYGAAPAARNAMLTGQYAVAKHGVLVNLRLLDTASNRVIAAYDYTVPLTRDTEELVEIPGAKKGWFGF